jgi:hypothetical protein
LQAAILHQEPSLADVAGGGDDERATALLQRPLALGRELGSRHTAARALLTLGLIALRAGRLDESAKQLREGVLYAQEHAGGVAYCLNELAGLHAALGDTEEGRGVLAASEHLLETIGKA